MVERRCAMTKDILFFQQHHHRPVDFMLGTGIHTGGCFIENENSRIAKHTTGNGQQLPLSHGNAFHIIVYTRCQDVLQYF